MPTIDFYTDLAKSRCGFKSDRELCEALGFSSTAVSNWRTKKAWPSDDTMVRLAELAGRDPARALLDLNAWRAEGPAKALYTELAMRIAGAILALFLTGTNPAQSNSQVSNTVYYGKLDISFSNQIIMNNRLCFALRNIGCRSGDISLIPCPLRWRTRTIQSLRID